MFRSFLKINKQAGPFMGKWQHPQEKKKKKNSVTCLALADQRYE